ncbi:MAG: hypothetical protein AB1601_03105, partial [Planctomycetota bacterium]
MDFYRFFKGMALSMLQMTAEGMICAFVPGGVFIVGGYHMAHAGVDMWQEGLSLSNCLEMGLGAAPFAGKLIGGFTKGLARMRASRAAAAGAAATGELHHAISMKIWKALERNLATKGKYTYRDPRFVTRARDAGTHRGYQGWHRQVDDELWNWITTHKPTAEQFEAKLYSRYCQRAGKTSQAGAGENQPLEEIAVRGDSLCRQQLAAGGCAWRI